MCGRRASLRHLALRAAAVLPALHRLRTTTAIALSWKMRRAEAASSPRSRCRESRQPEIFQEFPKMLVPAVAVERKTPEIVEQHGGGDHVEYEQQRRLATIKPEQDANRADDFEHAAEHQQQHRDRCRQR